MSKLGIQFFEKRKIFYGISLGLILIGIIFNVIFGTQMDIQFTGGAMIKYSYVGEATADDIASVVSDATGEYGVKAVIYENVVNGDGISNLNNVTVSFGGTEALSLDQQKAAQAALEEKYPDSSFEVISSSSVNPVMGRTFFWKCVVAVLLAFLLLIVYISFRFRKIGGLSASLTGIAALLHDIIMVYFVFVIFRIPLNDSFIAVVLTILGYSMNDTIVIFDRIRENRKLINSEGGYGNLIDTSLNQVFSRSVYTSLTTFAAILVVLIVGFAYNIDSIKTFALPMMVGVVVGCYSSLCIASPLSAQWCIHKARKAEQR